MHGCDEMELRRTVEAFITKGYKVKVANFVYSRGFRTARSPSGLSAGLSVFGCNAEIDKRKDSAKNWA